VPQLDVAASLAARSTAGWLGICDANPTSRRRHLNKCGKSLAMGALPEHDLHAPRAKGARGEGARSQQRTNVDIDVCGRRGDRDRADRRTRVDVDVSIAGTAPEDGTSMSAWGDMGIAAV
jgi:hypothetical protein